jgi:protein-lysine N-methyltransferase EEF2KMT
MMVSILLRAYIGHFSDGLLVAGCYRPTGLKILELGAGTGLLSIFLCHLLDFQLQTLPRTAQGDFDAVLDPDSGERMKPRWEVVATDYHPIVLENLKYNIQLNASHSPSTPSDQCAQTMLRGERLDWQEPLSLKEEEKHDLIFGADIVYEKGHAELIRRVVERALKRPSVASGEGIDIADRGGVFWLMHPLRHTHTAESESIERIFGIIKEDDQFDDSREYRNENEDEWSLRVLEVQGLSRKKGIGRGDDEIWYRLLKIGWIRNRKVI